MPSDETTDRWGDAQGIPPALLVVAGLLVGAVGCGPLAPSEENQPDGEVCRVTSQCPDQQICRNGYCSAQKGSVGPLRFRFAPPNSSSFLPQLARQVNAGPNRPINFALEPSVVVSGEVSYQNSSTPGPSGSLIFDRKDVSDPIFDREVSLKDGSFQAFVLPGRYDLSLVPSDASLPSKVWTDREFRNDTKVENLQIPTLPANTKRFVKIQGNLKFEPALDLPEGETQPVEGARVYAISNDGSHVTSADISDEDGFFSIRAIPNSGDYRFRIESASPARLIPNVTPKEAFTVRQEPVSRRQISLGRYPQRGIEVRLGLKPPSSLANRTLPWAKTDVIAEAQLGHGTLTRRFDVSQNGEIIGGHNTSTDETTPPTLLPAHYTFWVLPPLNAPLAPTSLEIDLSRGGRNILPRLKQRKFIEGRVVDASGEPVGNAELRLYPSTPAEHRFDQHTPLTTMTAEDGSFGLWLDTRDYVGLVSPARPDGLPRRIVRLSTSEIDEEQTVDWQLAEPIYVTGMVRGRSPGDTTKPVGDTTVDARIEVGGRSLVLGESETDEHGEFGMILPATLSKKTP